MNHSILPLELVKAAYNEAGLPASEFQRQAAMTAALQQARHSSVDSEDLHPGEVDFLTFDAEQNNKLPGELVLVNDQDVEEGREVHPSVKRLHEEGKLYERFRQEVYGAKGWDGKSADYRAIARYDDDGDSSKGYDNAFATKDDQGRMIIVFGTGNLFLDFTLSPGIYAHESRHQRTELYYVCMSRKVIPGALNEHFSDVEHFMYTHWRAHQLGEPVPNAYLVGSEIMPQELIVKDWRAIRDMMFPGTAYPGDPQPAHMKDYKFQLPLPQFDMGGVHSLSGPPNRAMALFWEASLNAGLLSLPWELGPIYETAENQLGTLADLNEYKLALISSARAKKPELAEIMREALAEVGI